MNDERGKQSMDELVSATYRDHSTERAPEDLNRRILKLAAEETSRSRNVNALFGSWTKPLALAATVALSFAIVLEVTKLPQDVATAPTATLPAVPASDSLREDFTPRDNSAVTGAREQARLRDGSNRDESLIAQPQAVIDHDARQSTAAAGAPAETLEEEVVHEPAPAAKAMLTSDDEGTDRARRNASMDYVPSDSVVAERTVGSAAAPLTMALEKKESDAEESCEAKERKTAADWLACIERLRLAGADSQADREYEQYILKFPVE